jgi:hypothetical protein
MKPKVKMLPLKANLIYQSQDVSLKILTNETEPCCDNIRKGKYENCFKVLVYDTQRNIEKTLTKSELIHFLTMFKFNLIQ